MKIYTKNSCNSCKQLDILNLDVNIIDVESEQYNGVLPNSVPLLQFNNGIQVYDVNIINTILAEINNALNKNTI
jgi:hypothetical protein